MRTAKAALAVLALAASGCASTQGTPVPEDPWQGMNRGIFSFNETADRWVLEPAARGWNWAIPEFAKPSVTGFFRTVFRDPITFLNDGLQGKPVAAFQDLSRLVLNCTFGLVGIFDVATDVGIPQRYEDFGQTLGVWGLSSGPYLVLPLLGPSSVRDTGGLAVDAALSPMRWFAPIYLTYPLYIGSQVDRRAGVLDEVEQNRKEALDYYVFVRDAYLQYRAKEVRDGRGEPAANRDDLYDVYDLDEENGDVQ